MPSAAELTEHLQTAFPGAEVVVRDLTGTGDHFEVRVTSEQFNGQPMREQHQRIYGQLEHWVKAGALHALALITQGTKSTNPTIDA